jgi:hypothetical protein
MSDKNLEQGINIKFCVKIGKSASETLALLTVACDDYATKKSECFWMVYEVQGRERRSARWPKKWPTKNAKDRCKCGQSTKLGTLISKIRCQTNSRRIEYE